MSVIIVDDPTKAFGDGRRYLEIVTSSSEDSFNTNEDGNELLFEVNEGDSIHFGAQAFRESGDGELLAVLRTFDKDQVVLTDVVANVVTAAAFTLSEGIHAVGAGVKFVSLRLRVQGATVSTIARFDNIFLNPNLLQNALFIASAVDKSALIARAISGQTAPVFVVENNAQAQVFGVDAAGHLGIAGAEIKNSTAAGYVLANLDKTFSDIDNEVRGVSSVVRNRRPTVEDEQTLGWDFFALAGVIVNRGSDVNDTIEGIPFIRGLQKAIVSELVFEKEFTPAYEVDKAFGFLANIPTLASGVTVREWAGLFIDAPPTGGGAITQGFGIQIEDISLPTTKGAIKLNATGLGGRIFWTSAYLQESPAGTLLLTGGFETTLGITVGPSGSQGVNAGSYAVGGTTVIDGNRAASLTGLSVDSALDATLQPRFDVGLTTAQALQLLLQDRGTTEWVIEKNAANDFKIIDQGVADRIVLIGGGDSTFRTGSLTADHLFQKSNGAALASILDAGVLDVVTGFRISGVASSGRYLRGNGTNFVSALILDADLPTSIARDSELHNQTHVLAGTSGLGADHTVSGLAARQVLIATGATAALFRALVDADIPNTITLNNINQITTRPITALSGVAGKGQLPTAVAYRDEENIFTLRQTIRGNLVIDNNADAAIFAVLDAGSAAAQNRTLLWRDRGTDEWQMAVNTLNRWVLTEIGVADRLTLLPGGANFYRVGTTSAAHVFDLSDGTVLVQMTNPADGNVAMLVRRNVGGSLSLQQVSMGATDSGGSGFKLLRVPN